MICFQMAWKRPDFQSARKERIACPVPVADQRMPEHLRRWAISTLFAASTTPLPMGRPSAWNSAYCIRLRCLQKKRITRGMVSDFLSPCERLRVVGGLFLGRSAFGCRTHAQGALTLSVMDRIVQGRRIGCAELEEVRGLLSAHPVWSRSQVSVALCERWDWRDGSGRLKDIAARSLLRKLSGEGLIRLPALRCAGRGSRRRRASARVGLEVDWSISAPFSGPLSALQPVSVAVAEGSDRLLLHAVLERLHYLGLSTPVGESLGHLVRDRAGRIVGCSLTGLRRGAVRRGRVGSVGVRGSVVRLWRLLRTSSAF